MRTDVGLRGEGGGQRSIVAAAERMTVGYDYKNVHSILSGAADGIDADVGSVRLSQVWEPAVPRQYETEEMRASGLIQPCSRNREIFSEMRSKTGEVTIEQ